MSKKNKMANFFINAFYESKFRDNFFVVKAGGKIIEDQKALDNLIANIRELSFHGIKILLVYGGGRALDEAIEKRGIGIKKKDGRRITDDETLALMKEVVGGTLALSINESMARNNLEGYTFNAVPHEWLRAELRAKKPVDYGYVGDIRGANKRAIARLFKVTNFVACGCMVTTDDGTLCNVNADTIATELAIGASADKLIFLSDVDGVEIDEETAFTITAEQIPGYIKDGTATGGMQVKLENCLKALDAGVKRIHLINGLRDNALYKEIFEPVGPGTMLFKESERENYMNEVEAQKAIAKKP
ncbi:MAG: acetylglutamate kinase [Micavibrio sp.]|nr:MAG: acetylglutamate kinase [Micavibrio sp.]